MATGVDQAKSEIDQMLVSCGIPDNAIKTTLPRMGQTAIREYVAQRRFETEAGLQGTYLYSRRPSDAIKARLAFHVLAKEMLLSGVSCYVMSLTRLVAALSDDEDEMDDRDYHRATDAKVLFVTDFYEHGAAFPVSPWQAARVRNWIKDKYETGGAVSLLGDAALMQASSWWPGSFLSFLQSSVREFEVAS